MRRWTTPRSSVWSAGTRVPPEFDAALRAYAALAERDDDTIHHRGGSMLLAHGRPTARAVLFLHGLTASPMQCNALARRLHANGDSVIVPRLPGHGARDRLTTQLRDVPAQHLIDAAYEGLAIARGLGASVVVAGFSLGGMIAQQLALEHPQLVGRLILLGTGPRGGEGMTFTELSPEEQADPVAFLLAAFFSPSEASQSAGREYVKRLESRKTDRDLPVSRDAAVAQVAALREWGTIPATGRYATLTSITHPTLIVHGNKDIVVTPINAFILEEHLPNAQLIMYPDASHAAYSQYAENFLENARLFLRG